MLPAGGLVRAAFLAILLLAAGCVVLESTEENAVDFPDAPRRESPAQPNPRDAGNVLVQWPAETSFRYSAYFQDLVGDGEFAAWMNATNAMVALPYDIPIRHTECGIPNAYYSPEEREVVLCWELLDEIHRVMRDPQLTTEEVAHATGSAWLFVVFHELGHALVDAYDLPITGREEDAVDDLATLTLVDAQASDAAVEAALYWLLSDPGAYTDAHFADEHSLNPQRFYTILCTVYGSDPPAYGWLVEEQVLTPERAARCPAEYERKQSSWGTLLAAWMQG